VFSYLVWRSLHSLLLLWLVTVVVFGLLHLTPGDPASLMLGEQATPEQIRDLRHALGLNEPLITQYARFLGQAVRGDIDDIGPDRMGRRSPNILRQKKRGFMRSATWHFIQIG